MTRLPVHRFPDRTLPAQLVATAGRFGQKPFLHFFDPALPEAPPRLVTYRDFRELTARAAAFLASCGLAPGERVLLLAENSPEWLAVSFATQALRAEPAGLFSVLSAGACESIARRVRPRVIYVSSEAQWLKLAPAAADLVAGGLRAVLSHQPLPAGTLPPGLRAVTVAEVIGPGRRSPPRLRRPRRRGAGGRSVPAPLHQRHHRPPEGGAALPALHRRRRRLRRRRLPDHGPTTSACTCSPSATWRGTTSSAWRWPRGTPWR